MCKILWVPSLTAMSQCDTKTHSPHPRGCKLCLSTSHKRITIWVNLFYRNVSVILIRKHIYKLINAERMICIFHQAIGIITHASIFSGRFL